MGEAGYLRCISSLRLDLLDALGRGYVIDHCARVLVEEAVNRRYRAYVTDALMAISENTARVAGGRRLTRRWLEGEARRDGRSPEEIARGVMRGAGLRFA